MGASRLSSPHLLFLVSLATLFPLFSSSEQPGIIDVSLDNPVVHFTPSLVVGQSCLRVRVTGRSRLNLKSYANAFRVRLNDSGDMPERLHGKIEIYFHRNASAGLCQWEKGGWQALQSGSWSAIMSPYEERYIDVKFGDKTYGSVTVSVEEEFQQWRLFCLGFGFLLLLLAPIVSYWVPFYYSTSMVLGVLLVVLIILFQGMKLLPLGRKNVFYLTLYSTVLGIGSLIAHYFSTVVSSILLSLGLSEDMHNPVSMFLLVGLALTGAALGYWIVRKFVLSEDGNVDDGIAQFAKWSLRIIAIVFFLQSTLDPLLAVVALTICWSSCSLLTSIKWRRQARVVKNNLWLERARQASVNHRQAEFFSPAGRVSGRTARGSPSSPWSNSPRRGNAYSYAGKDLLHQEDHYSSFHKKPTRKYSKKEWEEFTRESTRGALSAWASSPEVNNWIAENAHRMRLDPDTSSEDSIESSEGSSEETAVENGAGLGLFRWY